MRKIVGKYVLLSVLLLLWMSHKGLSQIKSQNEDVWFHYVGKNGVTEKLSFTFEATMRFANGFSEKQQWFVRPSVDYQFTKKFAGGIGYSHYNTYSYGNPAMNKSDSPEDHIWIQGTFVHHSGAFKFTHRLRDENRFVGIVKYDAVSAAYEVDRYDYRNRLRYMFLVYYPLLKKDGQTKLSSFLGDEMFLNIGKNVGKTLFNQNRMIAGLGYHFNLQHQVQLSYIHQYIWNFGNTIQENNPTLRVSYLTTFDWYKKKG